MNEMQSDGIPSQEEITSQQLYWQNKLSGNLPETTLSVGNVKPLKSASGFELYTFELPADLSERVFKLTKKSGLSIYSVLVAALTILVHKYTGSEDVIIGSPSYRPHSGSASTNNIVPLRFDVKGSLKFKDYLLRNVKPTIMEAYSNQDVPFEKIVESLKVAPEESGPAIINILALLKNIHDESQVEEFHSDLKFSFVANEHVISARVKYNPAMFKEMTLERMLNHYLNTLRSALNDPDVTIGQASILSNDEKRQLLIEFNQSAIAFPSDKQFSTLFEERIKEIPDRVAITCDKSSLTYAQLNARANRLAHHLRSMGVGPEVMVALFAIRSTDFLVALLAIFKSGGAYLPLDRLSPPNRLSQILVQSKAGVLIASDDLPDMLSQMLSGIPAAARPKVINIDELLQMEESEENIPPPCEPGNLAYMIYTSGSTGVAKGAMIEHRGMVNHLFTKIVDLELTAADIVAQTAPQSFDISIWQFLAVLLVGGQVRVVNDEVARDPIQLLEVIEHSSITILQTVPSLVQATLIAIENLDGGQPRLSSLRWMVVNAETLLPETCRQWLNFYPDIPLINYYGATECSDDATCHPIYQPPPEDQLYIPVGRPIANVKVHILDATLSPVPISVPGEIYLSGIGVGRGYFCDPMRTAEAFIPDPFGSVSGARIYKTGDLGRYRKDGNIEFLMRIDHQVKIRGYRIELGEIEAVLSLHEGVREAVVLAREDVSSDKMLVAYLVPANKTAPAISELQSFLRERLTEYMIPAAFVIMDAFPLTPNGKVDRRALPPPARLSADQGKAFVAPRTRIEKMLAGVWAEVLRLKQVGVHDNFFELGGDSILGIHIVSKANQHGLRLTPKQVFEHQTIAELATVAEISSATRPEAGPVTGRAPLTPIQARFFEQNGVDPDYFNHVLMFEIGQPLDIVALEGAIRHLPVHHDGLRLRIERKQSGRQQLIAGPGNDLSFTRIDLSLVPYAEQGQVIEAASRQLQTSLSLTYGPIMRVVMFDLGGEKPGRLLMVANHLAVDIVSWQILLEDLWTAYQQLVRGEAIELPPKTTSFKQWAERISHYAKSEALERELGYWLAGIPSSASKLPVDYRKGDNIVAAVNSVSLSLSVEQTKEVLHEVPKVYHARINDILLTALAQALSRWVADGPILIDIEGHGRDAIFEDVDLSRTVGWFTTIYPLVLNPERTQALVDALRAVKQQIRGAPNGGNGYGPLRYIRGGPEIVERLRSLPRAEVLFNYGGQFDQALPVASPLTLIRESSGVTRSPKAYRDYLLEVNAFVVGGQLTASWAYSENLHRRTTIERLAEDFMKGLRAFIAHSQDVEWSAYTPSDFPGAKLSQEELDKFIGGLKRAGER